MHTWRHNVNFKIKSCCLAFRFVFFFLFLLKISFHAKCLILAHVILSSTWVKNKSLHQHVSFSSSSSAVWLSLFLRLLSVLVPRSEQQKTDLHLSLWSRLAVQLRHSSLFIHNVCAVLLNEKFNKLSVYSMPMPTFTLQRPTEKQNNRNKRKKAN